MTDRKYDIGMVGLGVMGSNMVLNMMDHGFSCIGYDVDPKKGERLRAEAKSDQVTTTGNLDEFVAGLKPPRMAMLLVPAGPPVDAVIHQLVPRLETGDIIIDGGNSHFTDTNIRQRAIAGHQLHLLGVGISGGEEGARRGPCIMPGGPKEAYEHIRPIFEAVAAHVNGDPCVTYLGPGSAGHYVKMVHNGIEYGLMQLIADTYDLMKRGLGLNDDELHDVYAEWNSAELGGFLMEITAQIFLKEDAVTHRRLIDVILDVARQKGTGMWASQDAMDLHLPVPLIDTAVEMRDLSGFEGERKEAARLLSGPAGPSRGDRTTELARLHNAMYIGMVFAYAQGLAQMQAASNHYGYGYALAEIARIWRGGCIIRAAFLERIRQIYQAQPGLTRLFLDPGLAAELSERQDDLRHIVRLGAELGIPLPGFMSVLGNYDAYRSTSLPANLIQAQRDYFGAHTYERIDEKGVFHTEWEPAV